jgi:hypothetical protein
VTAAETDEPSQLSPQGQSTADKPITATEQQIKARAELGVSVDVSRPYPVFGSIAVTIRKTKQGMALLKIAN